MNKAAFCTKIVVRIQHEMTEKMKCEKIVYNFYIALSLASIKWDHALNQVVGKTYTNRIKKVLLFAAAPKATTKSKHREQLTESGCQKN